MNPIYLFKTTFPYIIAEDNILQEAYTQVPNKENKSENQILDLMKDYILSHNLQEEVIEWTHMKDKSNWAAALTQCNPPSKYIPRENGYAYTETPDRKR